MFLTIAFFVGMFAGGLAVFVVLTILQKIDP